jgi:putative transposase
LDTKSTSHCKYNINYHLVWCPQYRHKVLTGEIEAFLKNLINTTCQEYGYKLLNLEVMSDHLHLFISAPPTIAPIDIVKTIKSITKNAIECSDLWSEMEIAKVAFSHCLIGNIYKA